MGTISQVLTIETMLWLWSRLYEKLWRCWIYLLAWNIEFYRINSYVELMKVPLKRNRQLSVYGLDNFDLGSEIKYLWEGETSSKWSRFHFVLIKIVMFARSAQWSIPLSLCSMFA